MTSELQVDLPLTPVITNTSEVEVTIDWPSNVVSVSMDAPPTLEIEGPVLATRLSVMKDGVLVGPALQYTTLDFHGANIIQDNSDPTKAVITIVGGGTGGGGGLSGIEVFDEGVEVAPTVTAFDFVGPGIEVTYDNGTGRALVSVAQTISTTNIGAGFAKWHLAAGDNLTVPDRHQYIVHGELRLDVGASISVQGDGEIIVLDPDDELFEASLYRDKTSSDAVYAPGRRNMLLNTDTMTTSWTATNMGVSSNSFADLDGGTTSDKLTPTVTNGQHYLEQSVWVESGSNYTFTVYARQQASTVHCQVELRGLAGSDTVKMAVNLASGATISTATTGTGVLASHTVTDMGSGWFKIIITARLSTSDALVRIYGHNGSTDSYAGDGSNGFYVTRVQFEPGAIATEYVQRELSDDVYDVGLERATARRLTLQGYIEQVQPAANSGTAYTMGAYYNGNHADVVLTGNATITLPVAPTASSTVLFVSVKVKQDATGGRTLAFAAQGGDTVKWNGSASIPLVNSTANKATLYSFRRYQGDTTWYGNRDWIEN